MKTNNNKMFIGVKYSTDKKKRAILKDYDEFQLNKLEFLNEKYTKISTMYTTWYMYKRIRYLEVIRNRDIMNFTKDELEMLLKCKKNFSTSYKNSLYNFLLRYLDYCVEEGYIEENICKKIDFPEISKPIIKKENSEKFVFHSLNYYKNILSMRDCRFKHLNIDYYFPILLARYGITGTELCHIRNIKVTDIDFDNKCVYIYRNNEKVTIPVDDYFLSEIEPMVYSYNKIDYMFNYTTTTLYNKHNAFFNDVNKLKVTVNKDSYASLVLMREFEILLKIREKRKLQLKDLQKVHNLYNDKSKTYRTLDNLKEMWKKYTNEELIHGNSDDNKLYTSTDKEFANAIASKLGIDLDNIPVIS